MECDEFLEGHSEYLDGMLAAREAARFRAHVELCMACARYDSVVRRGQALVQDLPEIEPSHDFELRLQHRIFHLEDESLLAPARGITGTATLAIAAALAIVAWSPMLVRDDGVPIAPGVAVPAAAPANVVNARPVTDDVVIDPLFSQHEGWYPAPVSAPAATHTLAAFPGPYSPLVVTPPVHRAVRTVSTEYVPVH